MQNLKSVKRKLKSQASKAISAVVNDRGFEFRFGRRRCQFAHHDGAEYFSAPNARVETELPKLLDHIHTFIRQIESLDVDPLEVNRFISKYFSCEAKTIKALRGLRVVELEEWTITDGQMHFMNVVHGVGDIVGAKLCQWNNKASDMPDAVQEDQSVPIQE
jgi:hypothetical protein